MRSISQKLLSGVLAAGMVVSAVSSVGAANIGTGSVAGSGALDVSVVWDDAFPGFATGAVNGLVVKARVNPVLNMVISGSGVIDLGVLTSDSSSTGSVNVEVGTNAVNGASVTARSTNGGLANSTNGSILINDDITDEVADSYKFLSATGSADDSSYTSFSQSAILNAQVNDDTTNHILYTSNKPQKLENVDDFVFSVAAQPSIETPAGDYSDVVVVTVTGNF